MTLPVAFVPGQALVAPSYAANTSGTSLAASISGGEQVDSISMKSGRFLQKLGGQIANTTPGPLSIVILGQHPHLARKFYIKPYDGADTPSGPDCYSGDNIAPSKNAKFPQASSCATCSQNIKNIEGKKKCAMYQRLAIRLEGDPEGRVYRFDAPGLTVYGPDKAVANQFNLSNYAKFLDSQSPNPIALDAVVAEMSIDENASVVKALFSPRSFVLEADLAQSRAKFDSKALDPYTRIEYGISGRVDPVQASNPSTGNSPLVPTVSTPTPPAPAATTAGGFGAPAATGFGAAPAASSAESPAPAHDPVNLQAATVDDILDDLMG